MNEAKITLSDKELSLIGNTEWILTKQSVTEKVYGMLGRCSQILQHEILPQLQFPAEVLQSIPKIYKGEQYHSLPYVMLDHPRVFAGEHAFAWRTFFWWGNFISISFHLAGNYRSCINENKLSTYLAGDYEMYIGIGSDPWQHHFEKDNVINCGGADAATLSGIFQKTPFIKLLLKFELDRFNEMEDLLQTGYEKMANTWLNCRRGETTLSPGIPTKGSDL